MIFRILIWGLILLSLLLIYLVLFLPFNYSVYLVLVFVVCGGRYTIPFYERELEGV